MIHSLINTAQAVSLPTFTSSTDLPSFINSVYSFSLTVVGIAILVRVVWGGFKLLTAAGNTNKIGEAKDMIKNAIIGAVLLFGAYLILYVINPDLVKNSFNFTVPSQTGGNKYFCLNGQCVLDPKGTYDTIYCDYECGKVTISGVQVINISANSAIVIWNTDAESSSQVEYTDPSGTKKSASGENNKTSHAVGLSDLSPSTKYSIQAISVSPSGYKATSAAIEFTTTAAPQ